ncbi:ubiquitin-like-conjugating enzyme ATG10 [Haliotis rufescens]|uniref:ubiquitin-like-conjugating enzyme ATG10 n=1 Tax=Haliotis rufescens TaxID=6454 RepID=UPI00201F65B0|nr:ubiquitin-like-conjugating enzyme ATG10 [Haliotis rufescens]
MLRAELSRTCQAIKDDTDPVALPTSKGSERQSEGDSPNFFPLTVKIGHTLAIVYQRYRTPPTWAAQAEQKWRQHNRSEVYLTKRCNIEVVTDNIKSSTNQKQSGGQTANQIIAEEEEEIDIEGSDVACLTTGPPSPSSSSSSSSSSVCQFEYHIVYSASYGVPVLYFNAYTQDGRLLSLDAVWNNVPQHYQDRFHHERWTILTQQEHPILGRPFFQLHPCHTADLMSKLDPHSCSRNYLLSWLSAVGPVVGLKIPLSYVTS